MTSPESVPSELPQAEDYRSTIEQAIGDTRQAIREALGYIEH